MDELEGGGVNLSVELVNMKVGQQDLHNLNSRD